MKILAIDIGSTYLKGAVLETQTEQLLEKQAVPMPEKMKSEQPQRFEIDAEAIYTAAKILIDALIEKYPDVASIWFDTQMHGHILTAPDGSGPKTYISWQDGLAEPLLPELAEQLGQEALIRMGTRYKAGLTVCSYYVRHQGQRQTAPMRLHTLGGYLIYRLSGNKETAHICHESMAASLGLYDCADRCWNKDTIRVIGAEQLILPRMIPHTEQGGEYRGIPLYGDIGDHQASVYGLDEADDKSIILTLGTAGILCMPAEQFVREGMESRPYFHGLRLLTRTRQPGGRTLDVLIQFYRQCAQLFTGQEVSVPQMWDILLNELPADGKGLRVLPDYFIGGGQGEISGISGSNLEPSALFAAGIAGLVDILAETVCEFRALRPQACKIVLCGGSLARLAYLQNALAEKTGLQVVCSEKQDEALYGLAKLAKELEK